MKIVKKWQAFLKKTKQANHHRPTTIKVIFLPVELPPEGGKPKL